MYTQKQDSFSQKRCISMPLIRHCTLCPRRCGTDRTQHAGPCGGAGQVKLARAALHQWEEPCLSGKSGAGAVFFSGCSLGCVYCQNASISWENFGKEISIKRLAEIFLELQEQGAHNLVWSLQPLSPLGFGSVGVDTERTPYPSGMEHQRL